MDIKKLVLAVVGLVTIECILILFGLLPLISQGSVLSSAFLFCRVILIIYSGWIASSYINAVKNGAIIAGVGTSTFLLAALIGIFIEVPVLGITISFPVGFAIVSLFSLALNVVLGILLSLLGRFLCTWFAPALPKQEKEPKKSNPKNPKKKK